MHSGEMKRMYKFIAKRIIAGFMTLDEVPESKRAKVIVELEKLGCQLPRT